MKKIVAFLFVCLLSISLFGETLSEKAKVTLLTCGSGEELYAQFGHTAIRINDPSLNIDVVFNYGTFNYQTKGFYLKFVKGITDYELGIDLSMGFFMRYYENNIPVWEQELNLTAQEKQALFDALMVNYQPQNRFYRYNFIYDNCATRPRDMIESVIGGKLLFEVGKQKDTFRELIAQHLGKDSWIKFGIDLVIGAPADKIATDRERMFLPCELMNFMQRAKRPNGNAIVISKTKAIDLPEKTANKPIITPTIAAFSLMLVILLVSYFRRNKCMIWLDAILFLSAGLMGFIIFYLNFFSQHPMVSPNYNLLWAQPLNILFVILLPIKKLQKALSYYQVLNAISIIIAISGYLFLPQKFHIAFLPLMIILLVRAIHYIRMQQVFIKQKPQ